MAGESAQADVKSTGEGETAAPRSGRRTLVFLSAVVALLIAALLTHAVGDLSFAPANEDESTNFGQVRLFYETGSVKSSMMIDEAAAPVLEANWYGPFYPIFYGGIMKVVGMRAAYYVLVNAVLLAIAVALILGSGLGVDQKPLAVLLLLVSPAATLYLFTFFPEELHLLFSATLALLLVRLARIEEAGGAIGRPMALFVAMTVLVSLFKVTNIFWLFGVLAFARDRRDWIRLGSLVAGGIGVIIVYMRWFTAPMWIKGGNIIGLLANLEIGRFVVEASSKLFRNLGVLFSTMDVAAFVLIVMSAALLGVAIIERRRLLTAAALVAWAHLAVLFTLYETYTYAFNRQTASLAALFAIITAASSSRRLGTIVVPVALLAFPQHAVKAMTTIRTHRAAYREYVARAPQVNAFREIRFLVRPDRESIVLWLYSEHDYSNRNAQMLLPVSTPRGKPIRYTTNVAWDNELPQEVKFRTYGRLKIDYVLSRYPLTLPGLRLITANRYYHFYEYTAATGVRAGASARLAASDE